MSSFITLFQNKPFCTKPRAAVIAKSINFYGALLLVVWRSSCKFWLLYLKRPQIWFSHTYVQLKLSYYRKYYEFILLIMCKTPNMFLIRTSISKQFSLFLNAVSLKVYLHINHKYIIIISMNNLQFHNIIGVYYVTDMY